jgi:hypothetical protein
MQGWKDGVKLKKKEFKRMMDAREKARNPSLPQTSRERADHRVDLLEYAESTRKITIRTDPNEPPPLVELEMMQELLARHDLEGIALLTSRAEDGQTTDLLRNEIVAYLERDPSDLELFDLAKRLYGIEVKFGARFLREYPFEPQGPIDISLP